MVRHADRERVLAVAVAGEDLATQAAVLPILAGKTAQAGRATAYVCQVGVCKLPATDPAELAAALDR